MTAARALQCSVKRRLQCFASIESCDKVRRVERGQCAAFGRQHERAKVKHVGNEQRDAIGDVSALRALQQQQINENYNEQRGNEEASKKGVQVRRELSEHGKERLWSFGNEEARFK